MKIGIQRNTLLDAINKGSLAAMFADVQMDEDPFSILNKTVKITANDKGITFESFSELISSKYEIKVANDSSIVIKEPGCVAIPAKELIKWLKAQRSDSTIGMILYKLDNPEVLNPKMDNEEYNASQLAIRRIGTVKLVSKDSSKSSSKWELDSYDTTQLPQVNFTCDAEKCFEIQGGHLSSAIGKVSEACLSKDHEHILDSISIQPCNDDLYFAATDMHHCSLYKIPKEYIKDFNKKNLLIPSMLLKYIIDSIGPENNIAIYYHSETNKLFLNQNDLTILLASADRKYVNKFPTIQTLLSKQYEPALEISKKALEDLLGNASVVNKFAALFVFNKENNTLSIKAISEDNKYKPIVRSIELDSVKANAQSVWSVTHMIKNLKELGSEYVILSLSENTKTLKISGKGDDSWIYFTLCIEDPKYKDNTTL